jgi:ribosomal protein L11 methyltransferase
MSWRTVRVVPSGVPASSRIDTQSFAQGDTQDNTQRDVRSDTHDTARERVIAALFDVGSQGIHEDGDAIVTHFPPDTNLDAVCDAVRHADPGAQVTVTDTPAVSWDEWRANVGAHQLGQLVVAPPWLASDYDPAHTIVIDPAMAFGTGEHPTTRGVVRLMQRVIRPNDLVADLGAGSAVLAIAAAKLGASRVVAIELDPDAESNAEENIARNDVSDRVRYLVGDASVLLPLVAPVRVVLANIVSSVLLALLPTIARAITQDGDVILSGILYDEREMMLSQFARSGWAVSGEDREGDWWSVAVRRAEPDEVVASV